LPSSARRASSPAPLRDDTGARQLRRSQQLSDLLGRELDRLQIHRVALRERYDAARDPEQLADRQVFARLRHDALVGGDCQQQQVDARGTGDHGAHEPLVTGDVHHPDARPPLQVERREAEIERDAAGFLFRQPIGVDAGERVYQCGLAVIDVTGRAEDEAGLSADRHGRGPRTAEAPRGCRRSRRRAGGSPAA
jgi:hypothetical protein